MTIRTRFAPSPTGTLHVGSIRTALFSWLYARHHKGQFILRIEDTDQERSTQESVQAILDGMAWLGMDYDEGPIYQTQRYDRYKTVAGELLENGKAYRCTCSKERLEKLREQQMANKEKPRYDGHCRDKNILETNEPFVIRFKTPHTGSIQFTDQVYGEIHVNNSELDDVILIRSDGHPTYNFAVVVDDSDMKISHVIRGDDHINNTPRQIHLFNAIGAPVPIFAHLPMILGEDGKRLSKRHGAVNVMDFRDLGILPHAMLNYLVRLGWSCGDQEIFSHKEMVEKFDLDHVSRGVSSFNHEKLYWLNQHYQKNDTPSSIAPALAWHFEKAGIDITKGPKLEDLIQVQAERCKSLMEMCEISTWFYTDSVEYDEDAVKKHLRPVILEPLTALYERLKQVDSWERNVLQEAVNDTSMQFDINMGKIAQPLRVAVTGSSVSPSIDMTLTLLGREKVLSRLERALEMIRVRASQ